MAHDHRSHEGADKLYNLIDDIRICMMTTRRGGRAAGKPAHVWSRSRSAGDL